MMFSNRTALPAGWTMGFRRDGRELLVVIVKATYTLPKQGNAPALAAEQAPLVGADVFTGEPGLSAPRYESDFAHHKPQCDVLLVGSAHAPGGRPAERCTVGLSVGAIAKRFRVVGPRVWRKRLGLVVPSPPERFLAVPLSYDLAWGGTDRTREAEGHTDAYLANPVGRGYWRDTTHIDGAPLAQTEVIGKPIESHRGEYVPQAFSPIGRNWMPRARLAGTYDASWLENNAPLWPQDFDERYFQAAPADQLIRYPEGNETVVLENLTPDGTRAFVLPTSVMPITFLPHKGRDVVKQAVIDTLVFEPDDERFSTTWRCTLPLGRSVFDVKEVVAGEMSAAWHRARRFPGKPYYSGLGELVRARGKRRRAG